MSSRETLETTSTDAISVTSPTPTLKTSTTPDVSTRTPSASTTPILIMPINTATTTTPTSNTSTTAAPTLTDKSTTTSAKTIPTTHAPTAAVALTTPTTTALATSIPDTKKATDTSYKKMAPPIDCTNGCGLNVVTLTDKNTFQLDEGALERILLRDDIKDLPVVVVSVAGAYRGGKSFLLDFFLRYLNAPESSRNESGAWLGDENKPLTGFSWRGGSKRHTTGIVMWSEPFVCDLSTGEKVAVLLLDTQGTFDSSTTMRDCSTIFALSTLLASVQIYNISTKIKEDDLQHLQFFTEYGRLVQNEDRKAFQTLRFLIRDWQFPYEYSYGLDGGKKVLEKWLAINEELPQEMRELRQHISSSFENIDCFLMPHPGFNVFKPTFDGRLSDIAPEFKSALLELIPSVFAPSKLIPKLIKGTKITAPDLLIYIKSYMKIFNSDQMPSPKSIMEATSDAAMLSAVKDAKALYESTMEQMCGTKQPSWPRAALVEAHEAALQASRDMFLGRKKLATTEDQESYLAKLNQDLEARLPEFLFMNEGKTLKAIAAAKDKYTEYIYAVHGLKTLCLHPTDLKIVHDKAVLEATRVFNSQRKQFLNKNDEEKSTLLNSFAKEFKHLQSINEVSNRIAVSEIIDKYSSVMRDLNTKEVSEETFSREHEKALADAYKAFNEQRNRSSNYSEDVYKSKMTADILKVFSTMRATNRASNERRQHDAFNYYENNMQSFWYRGTRCLHPDDLEEAHNSAKRQALLMLHPNQSSYAEDSRKELLSQMIDSQYRSWKQRNENANHSAVHDAFRVYYDRMTNDCSPTGWWVFIVPMIVQKSKKGKYHENNKWAAVREFKRRRRYMNIDGYDPFYNTLINKINNAYYDF